MCGSHVMLHFAINEEGKLNCFISEVPSIWQLIFAGKISWYLSRVTSILSINFVAKCTDG